LFALLWPGALSAAVVINEIHYHPAGEPENPGEEWIELHNTGPLSVDLAGYQFDQGISFLLPPGTVVPSGGFLVVAAEVPTFLAAHPGFAGVVLGGWEGRLSNRAESIRLRDPADATVDEVSYADEGEWGLRGRGPVVSGWLGHQGWEWYSLADGNGHTLERRNPLFLRTSGAAWAESVAPGGTPGAANSRRAADIAPVIENPRHRPHIPRSTDSLRVQARVTDDLGAPVSATLHWRVDGTASFLSLPMIDPDGDGEVEASLPPQAHLAVIEYFIEVSDGTQSRTWPAPARTSAPGIIPETFAQVCNALAQVDNSYDPAAAWVPGAQPILREILTAAERAELRQIGEVDDNSARQIDAAMNATVIILDGTGLSSHHRASVRNRGFGSRTGPPNNQHLSFPADHPWRGRHAVQLNARYGYAQVLAAAVFARGGIAVQEAVGAQLRINGLNPAVSGQGVSTFTASITYGGFALVEPMNDDWAERHYPLDPSGNIYRVDDHAPNAPGVIPGDLGSGEYRYEGENPLAYADTFLKKTNERPLSGPEPYSYADLIELCRVASAPATGGTAAQPAIADADYRARLEEVLDLRQWLTFIALDALIGNMEGGLQTGRSDDYAMYRGLVDPRFRLVPHDFDTCFTLGAGGGLGTTRSIFSYDGEAPSNATGNRLAGLVRLFNHPDILPDYYAILVDLLDHEFRRDRLDPLVDEIMVPWGVPLSVRNTAKNFVDTRRANVLGQIPRVNALTVTGDAAPVDGRPTSALGAFTLSGTLDVATVRSLRVNGRLVPLSGAVYRRNGAVPAGAWSIVLTPADGAILPGVNRLLVTYHDGREGAGREVARFEREVYYDRGPGTPVASDGSITPSRQTLHLASPAAYVPGLPFLVEVELRNAEDRPDPMAWDRTATLTASAGVSLVGMDGGPAQIHLHNGRGSLLVRAQAAGAGDPQEIFRYGSGGTGNSNTAVITGTPGSAWRAKVDFTSTTLATFITQIGSTWRMPGFDDSAWPMRATQTGYGDGDENQTFSRLDYQAGLSDEQSAPSYLFRNAFVIADPGAILQLSGEVKYDDAALIYINGVEVLRTSGLVGINSLSAYASAAPTSENARQAFTIDPGLLVPGTNIIAVAVHQADNSSSDVTFDLQLSALPLAVDPGNFTLTATLGALATAREMASLTSDPVAVEKSGTLAGSETWSGVVRVTGDVTVPAGATLTLARGTHVLMAGTPFTLGGSSVDANGADLIVLGALDVAGTEAEPVSITAADPDDRWGRIRFAAGGAPSALRHALLSRAGHSPSAGGHIPNSGGAMLLVEGTTLVLEDCVLADSVGKVMANTGQADLTLRRCHLARFVMGPEISGSAFLLEDSHITEMLAQYRERGAPDDEDCLYLHDSGGRPVALRRSVLARCDDDVLDGLGGAILGEDCIFRDGFDKGVSLLQNNLTLRRCLIIDNDIGVSAKCQVGADESVPYLTLLENCVVVATRNEANTSDGNVHSVGVHTRNKYGTSGMSITQRLINCVVVAEEPFRNDYPALDSTVFPLMESLYTCTQDLGGPNPTNAVPTGTGSFAASPGFLDLATRDLRLRADSPCRDTGDPLRLDPDGSRSDLGVYPFAAGAGPHPEIVWTQADSPYRVGQATTLPAGVTLRIEPGVNVYVDAGVRITVNGRLLAEGTPEQRIRFSPPPGAFSSADVDPIKNGVQTGAPKWGGLRIEDSLAEENRVHCVDFVNAQGTSPLGEENWGSLGFIRSWGWADQVTFQGTHLRMLYGRNSRLSITRCQFPDMFVFDAELGRIEEPADFLASADNQMEPLKVEYPTTDAALAGQTGEAGAFPSGLPRDGHFRVYANDFHGNRGHQDVFDADSGRWGVPGQFVLDCRYNTFHGLTGDEHIDLGGDAYVAHNRFYSGSKDRWTSDTGYSNAISTGDRGTGTTVMVARNVFFDLDHAVNLKLNTATLFEHNTCVDFHQDWPYTHVVNQFVACAAINLYVPNDGQAAGDGAYLGYNIFHGSVPAPDDTVNPDPPGGFPRLLSWADLTTTGGKTSVVRLDHNFIDEHLQDPSIGSQHPGGIFDPAWGEGNVVGDPRFRDRAARDFSLAEDSPARGTAPGGLHYGADIPEWAYILNAPAPLTANPDALFTLGGPGLVALQWRLDDGPWSAPVQIGAGGVMPRSGPIVRQVSLAFTDLPDGPHRLEVRGQDMAGNWQGADPARDLLGEPQAAPSAVEWTVDRSLLRVEISEIAALTADSVDWIELHNAGAQAVGLDGWSLSDDPSQPTRFVFAPGTSIAAGERLVVPATLSGVQLDRDGDRIALYQSGQERDALVFGPQALGFTLSRLGREAAWGLGVPTPAGVNVAAPLGDPADLRISEWLAAAAVHYDSDWIELHNPGPRPVALGGLSLTDNRVGRPAASVLPPFSYIGPDAYQVFLADGRPEHGAHHLAFALDAFQEMIALLEGDRVIHQVHYFPQVEDFSQGGSATGAPVAYELPTAGFANGTDHPAYANALALLRGLRISEIMYNAPGGNDHDWIELRNVGTQPFDLDGVAFVAGIAHTFGPLPLAPAEETVLVAHAASYLAGYGVDAVYAGVYSGRLDNAGEELALRLPAPFDAYVLRFLYSDNWYPITDGSGRSLELVSDFTLPRNFGDRDAWRASSRPGGSPAGSGLPIPANYPDWLTYFGVFDGLDDDLDGIFSLGEYALGLDPLDNQREQGWPRRPQAGPGPMPALAFRLPIHPALPGGHGRPDVTYTVQIRDSLAAGTWETLSTRTPTQDWQGPGTVRLGPEEEGGVVVVVESPSALDEVPRRYLRLLFSWTP
jgi:hypothetical protein